jgi:carbon storage regulator
VLVLTRKSAEAIRIGNDVRIVVLTTARGHVRIGIEAPGGVSVLREEVHERIADENRRAALPAASSGAAAANAFLSLATQEVSS